MDPPREGDTHEFERTFTAEDVRRFAELSGDEQPRHTDPDDGGRLLVHGLLTATMPTKVGGDLEVLAREMTFQFRRPVYTGDTITCTWTCREVEERGDRYDVVADVVCEDDDGEVVLVAEVEGLIRTDG